MRLGTAIVLLALGAILAFALQVDVSGIDLQLVGWILMIVGALGIVLELAVWGPRNRRRVTHSEGYAAPPPARRCSAPLRTRPTDGPPRTATAPSSVDGGCRAFGLGQVSSLPLVSFRLAG